MNTSDGASSVPAKPPSESAALELRADSSGEPAWFIDDLSHRQLLNLDERKQCYIDAQHSLEELSVLVAKNFDSNDESDLIASVFTPDYRRPDNLQGVFLFLYLEKIARALARDADSRAMQIHYPCPSWFVRYLGNIFVLVKDARPLRIKIKGIQWILDLYGALRFLQAPYPETAGGVNLETRDSAKDCGKSVLLKMPETGSVARYGNLVTALNESGTTVVMEDFDREELFSPGEGFLRTMRFVPFSERLAALGRALRLRERLRSVCKKEARHSMRTSPVFAPSTFGLARRFVQIRSWSMILESRDFDFSVRVSSFTKPGDRLLVWLLNKSGIPSILVFPRPVTKYRPAEKPLDFDLARPETLPTHFIVRDESSKPQLTRAGISPDTILIGAPVISPSSIDWPMADDAYPAQIIVLFPAREADNVALVEDLRETAIAHPDLKLRVKGHPNSGLRKSETAALERLGLEWTDVSQLGFEELVAPGALSLTSCSTASLEAALLGAGVVWAPFYSELAMPQMEFMENLGTVVGDRTELTTTLNRLLSNPGEKRYLSEKTHAAANRLYACKTTISQQVLRFQRELEA